MASDGTLVFDTSIDISGFTSGVDNLKQLLAATVSNISANISGTLTMPFTELPSKATTAAAEVSKSLANISIPTIAPIAQINDDLKGIGETAKVSSNKISGEFKGAGNVINNFGNQVKKSSNQASDGIDDIATSSKTATQSMSMLSHTVSTIFGNLITSAIRKATSAIAEIPKQMVSVGTAFESSMSQVAATMGITKATVEMGKLTIAAKEMGATTQFTAAQAGDALNYLALAGYSADKSIKALPTVLNLAAAGGMDLAYTSDLITDSMSALGLQMDELALFTEKMAVTAQKSNTGVAQLGQAILTVGGTAKTMAGGVTEMNTALGVLADNGIKGAEGGTALRNIIISLTSPTDTAAKAISNLGVSVYDTAGNMRALPDILSDFNVALGKMSSKDRTQALSDIFNKVDLKSINALLGTSAERFDELANYIDNSSGAVADMAKTMNDNLKGDLTTMQSALEGVGIAAYEKFENPMRSAVQSITKVFGDLTNNVTSGGLSDSLDKVADGFSDLAVSAIELVSESVLPTLVKLTSFLVSDLDTLGVVLKTVAASATVYTVMTTGTKLWTAAQLALNSAMSINPVILFGTAAIGLATGLASVIDKLSGVRVETNAYTEELSKLEQKANETVSTTKAEADAIREKEQEYELLRTNMEDLTENEMQRFIQLQNELSQILPESTQFVDEQTGAYLSLSEAVDTATRMMEANAIVSAKRGSYTTALEQLDDTSTKMQDVIDEFERQKEEYDGMYILDTVGANELDRISREMFGVDFAQLSEAKAQATGVINEFEEAKKAVSEYNKSIESTGNLTADDEKRKGEKRLAAFKKANDEYLAEQTQALSDGWNGISHDLAVGNITDEQSHQQQMQLLEKYGNAQLKEHWKYYEEVAATDKKAADDLIKQQEQAANDRLKAQQDETKATIAVLGDEWSNLDFEYKSSDTMTEQDLYNRRLELFEKYGDISIKEHQSYWLEIVDMQKSFADDEQAAYEKQIDEQKKTVSDGISNILDEYNSMYKELEDKRKAYRDRLMAIGGDIFEVLTETDEKTGKETKTYQINDINKQLSEMRKYNADVKKLKAEGMSSEFINELNSMSADEGAAFASYIANMSTSERDQLKALYDEKQKLADELSMDMFADETQQMQDVFTNSLLDLANNSYDYGLMSGQNYAKGFIDEFKKQTADMKMIVSAEQQSKVSGMVAGSAIARDVANSGAANAVPETLKAQFVIENLLKVDGKALAEIINAINAETNLKGGK